ncbi:hypothetical protein OAF44_03780 [Akkermansiaceae bacterium]|nr:hypothetical protein [Akkermansiaceae bacterium]
MLTLVAGTSNAFGALMSLDWKTSGDGAITVDTSTGLYWLDLTETRNKTIDEVESDFGGTYSGFRYATNEEIETLWASAGVVPTFPFSDSIAVEAQTVASFLGSWKLTSASYRWVTMGFSDGTSLSDSFGREYVQQPFIEYDIPTQPPFSPIRSGPKAASKPSRQKQIPSSRFTTTSGSWVEVADFPTGLPLGEILEWIDSAPSPTGAIYRVGAYPLAAP